MFTEAQIKRVLEIRRAVYAKADLKSFDFTAGDVDLLVRRIDDLTEPDRMLGAEPLMQWVRARLEEDLTEKREWLAGALEQMRIAELQVKEAEHALTAVKALVEGGIYASGGEIIERWDAMEALYASQGMLPIPEPAQIEVQEHADPPAPEPETPAKDFSDLLPPALVDQLSKDHPAKATKPPAVAAEPRPAPAPTVTPGEQEERLYDALKRLAAGEPTIQARLAVLAEESGVPKGSCHAVLHRLRDAGRITIIKPPTKNNVPQPNIYRFAEAEDVKPDEPEPAAAPVPPEVAAEKLAAAWGAKVTPKSPAPVRADAPLPERILAALRGGAAGTTMGLASMLGAKELAISQALSAMEHDGAVVADDIPEGGTRARLWRKAPAAEPS